MPATTNNTDAPTHGTCGACRRSVKLTKRGNLAHHGSRALGSGRAGACPGAGWAPIEVSDASLVAAVATAADRAAIAPANARRRQDVIDAQAALDTYRAS